MQSLKNQCGTIERLSACDFMVATAQQAYTDNNGTVLFEENSSFKHINSLVAVTILKESDLENSTINSISFEANNIASATTYSFTNTESPVSINKTEELNLLESSELGISMAEQESNMTLYFILNSGIDLSETTFRINYTTGTKSYTATKTNLGSATLKSGNRYNFNLNITDGVVSITGGEIEEWGEGNDMADIIINNPQESPNNENS